MSHKKKKLLINKVKLGMSLMEIIIAIAISAIALTTSAVFSTQLIYKSQENFMAESSSQFQNVIVQQLRLIESDMIAAVKHNASGASPIIPQAFANSTGTNSWQRFCQTGSATTAIHYSISLPKVADKTQSIDIKLTEEAPGGQNQSYTENNNTYVFVPVTNTDALTGAFALQSDASNTVFIAIRKTVPLAAVTGLEDPILLEVRIEYFILNKATPNYSRTTEVQFVKSLVCPTTYP